MRKGKPAGPVIRLLGFTVALMCVLFAVQDAAADAPAGQLVLVENGVSRAPIVIFEDAPPYTMEAANELAEYIEKVSGARPALIVGRPDPLPEHAIWVGYQPVMDKVFPDLDFDFRHPEEFLIAADENHLVIAGRDRWHPDHLIVEGRNWTIEGKQQEYGTANAAYTFLERYLGVRWLWPGDLGVDVIEQRTISFAPFEYRYHPQMRSRGGLFRLSALGDGRGYSHAWTRRQRLQLDSLYVPGGHGFTTWFDRFHETRPEYFGLQPDGTRSGFPGGGKAKLCQSNPEVWTQWIADVAEALKHHPNRTVFNASPNDSHHRGICICPDCRAWDNPNAERRGYVWEGLSQEYVAMSDRYITFANHLGERLEQRFPDRDLFVSMLAYGNSSPAPVAAGPRDNVIVPYVGHFPLADEERRAKAKEEMSGWAEKEANLMYRPNIFGANRVGLPDVALANTIEDWRFLAEKNCIGIYVDTAWENWATVAPQYYLMARLTWDPTKDGRAVLDDYYRRGFGPAADETEAYWTLVEEACRRKRNGGATYQEAYDGAFFRKASARMAEADAALADAPDKYRKRVAFVRAGLDMTRLIIGSRALADRYRQSEGEDTAALNQAKENWAKMKQIDEQHPDAFDWKWIRGAALQHGWMPREVETR